jgi:hypothetical protein
MSSSSTLVQARFRSAGLPIPDLTELQAKLLLEIYADPETTVVALLEKLQTRSIYAALASLDARKFITSREVEIRNRKTRSLQLNALVSRALSAVEQEEQEDREEIWDDVSLEPGPILAGTTTP